MLFALYLITKSMIIGLLAGAALVIVIIHDIIQGAKTRGVKKELREILTAVIFALGIWFALCFILGTSSPINAVVSCSMLPELQRGDLILLRGTDITATEIYMSNEEANNITKEAVIEYTQNTRNGKMHIKEGGMRFKVNGSLYSYCTYSTDAVCYDFRNNPSLFNEYHGPLLFRYATCEKKDIDTGEPFKTICLNYIEYEGKKYYANKTNDIIVYLPKEGDLFSMVGDIIHRVYFKIITPEGKIFYLTKGDNNPVADIQMSDSIGRGNSLVVEDRIKGKTFLRIPYIGHLKLLLAGLVAEPSGCDSVYV